MRDQDKGDPPFVLTRPWSVTASAGLWFALAVLFLLFGFLSLPDVAMSLWTWVASAFIAFGAASLLSGFRGARLTKYISRRSTG